MLSLPGYTLVEELPTHGTGARYRGRRTIDGVAVEILVAEAGSDDAASLFREYTKGAGLDIPGIVQPLLCENHGSEVILVRADCHGRPLSGIIPTGGMPLLDALRTVAGAAQVVHELHRKQRLHLALTPDSLLLDSAGQVHITGLGHVTTAGDRGNNALPENLAFMAPEQTGRTGFEIGPSTDLYALGVILYECLTGELPFRVREALDWIHCHIARAPILPRSLKPAIPPAVEQVVLKLLAKAPEERYHNAAGLAWDLLDCARRIENAGTWQDFRLGTHDMAPMLAIPAQLYGRASERQTVFDAWQQAADGRAGLLLLAGHAGLGKSTLALELQPEVTRRGGHFVAGKFDERNRATPYSSLLQALQELVRQLLAESDEQLAHSRQRLRSALGANSRIIIDTIPQSELIFGPQAPVPDLPPVESKIRFQRSLHDFICALAEAHRPLAIFLDDLQWADAASLLLLCHLLGHGDTRHLLVIGTYRDNEVDGHHPLRIAEQQMAAAGVPCTTLALPPLATDDVAALVAQTLNCPESTELAHLIETRTAGNPLFVRQFLLNLGEEKLLAYDSAGQRWTWDMASIEAAELSDNVAELLVNRLRRLALPVLEALRIAACLGSRFAVSTVAAVAGCENSTMEKILEEAVVEGMIGADPGHPEIYRFRHDRIQQAAYAMLDEPTRQRLHLAAGRALLAGSEQPGEGVFEIANQFQYSLGEVTDPAERKHLAAIYAQAGARAKAAAAYEAARAYLDTAAQLASTDLWQTDHALAIQLFADHAECEFLCGHADTAEKLFTRILEFAREAEDIARLHVLRMHLEMSQGHSEKAVEAGQQGLQRLGVHLPTTPGKITLLVQLAGIAAGMRGRRIEDLAKLPPMSDPLQKAVMQLYMNMSVAAYFVNRDLLALVAMRMVALSMRYGNTGSSAYAYVTFGMVIGGGFARYRDGYRFGELGRLLGEASGDSRYQGLSLSMCGIFTGAWGQPLATTVEQLKRSGRDLLDCGNLMMANYAAIATLFALDGKGENLPALTSEARRLGNFVAQIGFHDSTHYFLSGQRKALCLRGETAAGSLAGAGYDEAQQLALLRAMTEKTALAWHLVNRLQVAYLFGQYEAAKDTADELESMRQISIGQLYVPRQLFYAALTEAWPTARREQPSAAICNPRYATASACTGWPKAVRPTIGILTC